MDVDTLASESNKNDAYFHGIAALSLPFGSALDGMDTEAHHKYLKRVTKQCERTITLIDDCLAKFEQTEGTLNVEEQMTADMARLKKLPLAKQYREMTLWRRVRQFNEAKISAAKQVGYGRGVVERGEDDGLLQRHAGDSDEKFVSYREAYLSGVVERYQTDLNKIREKEGLDADQTKFLLSCLEAGADLFGNLRCIEDTEEEQ